MAPFSPSEIGAIIQSEWDWIIITLFVFYQLYWPEWAHPSEPKARRLIQGVQDDLTLLHERVERTDDKVSAVGQVSRAFAVVLDGIDEREVDSYVYDNGIEDPARKFVTDDYLISQHGREEADVADD